MNNRTISITSHVNTSEQEAFRFLSTNLILNKDNPNLKIISICSFNHGEGKTTIAVNLAIAFAKSGAKTLLIDADIRKPRELKFTNEFIIGLTNYRHGNKIDEIVLDTDVMNLKYVMAGIHTVDPVKFLSGNDYDSFLENVSAQFDIIIIDSPSIGNFVDGAIIAAKGSGVLIVATADKTSYKNIERIKWQMKNVSANVLGIVLNQIPRSEYKIYYNHNYERNA